MRTAHCNCLRMLPDTRYDLIRFLLGNKFGSALLCCVLCCRAHHMMRTECSKWMMVGVCSLWLCFASYARNIADKIAIRLEHMYEMPYHICLACLSLPVSKNQFSYQIKAHKHTHVNKNIKQECVMMKQYW